MKKNQYKVWGIILVILGLIISLFYFVHKTIGLIGGGFGLIAAGITLLNAQKKKGS